MSQPDPPLAAVLPRFLAEKLQRASQTPNTPGDPRARLKAVEEVTRHLHHHHPEYFRKDES